MRQARKRLIGIAHWESLCAIARMCREALATTSLPVARQSSSCGGGFEGWRLALSFSFACSVTRSCGSHNPVFPPPYLKSTAARVQHRRGAYFRRVYYASENASILSRGGSGTLKNSGEQGAVRFCSSSSVVLVPVLLVLRLVSLFLLLSHVFQVVREDFFFKLSSRATRNLF